MTVEIWTKDQEEFINKIKCENGQDIFSVRPIKPFPFMRHNMKILSASKSTQVTFVYAQTFDTSFEHYPGNMIFKFTVPEICGKGSISYCDYFGYSAIDSIDVKIGNAVMNFSGSYLFDKVKSLPNNRKIFEDAGHNDICREESVTRYSCETIKDSQVISVLLVMPFTENFPKNNLKLATNDNFIVTINMNHMDRLLNRNVGFNPTFKKYSDHELFIDMITKPKSLNISYEPIISLPLEISGYDDLEIPLTKNIYTRLDCDLSGKTYLQSYGNWSTEKDVISKLEQYLLNNILIIYPAESTMEMIQNDFPDSANIIPVVDGKVEFIVHSSDEDRPKYNRIINIGIKGLPKSKKLVFNSNALVILDKKDPKNSLNLSEKFKSIKGYYDDVSGSITFLNVVHYLRSQYASLPLEIFKKYGYDNRRLSDRKDMMIFTYFTNGPNMFNDNYVSEFSIKFNLSDFGKGYVSDEPYLFNKDESIYNKVNFIFEQNSTRFIFENFDEQLVEKMHLNFRYPDFYINKLEYNCTSDVKDFNDCRHTEKHFEALYNKTNIVVLFNSYILSQQMKSSDPKSQTKTELIRY